MNVAETWHAFRAELEAKDKWELEAIVGAQLRKLPDDGGNMQAIMALHLLQERASMHSTRS